MKIFNSIDCGHQKSFRSLIVSTVVLSALIISTTPAAFAGVTLKPVSTETHVMTEKGEIVIHSIDYVPTTYTGTTSTSTYNSAAQPSTYKVVAQPSNYKAAAPVSTYNKSSEDSINTTNELK